MEDTHINKLGCQKANKIIEIVHIGKLSSSPLFQLSNPFKNLQLRGKQEYWPKNTNAKNLTIF